MIFKKSIFVTFRLLYYPILGAPGISGCCFFLRNYSQKKISYLSSDSPEIGLMSPALLALSMQLCVKSSQEIFLFCLFMLLSGKSTLYDLQISNFNKISFCCNKVVIIYFAFAKFYYDCNFSIPWVVQCMKVFTFFSNFNLLSYKIKNRS